MSDDRLDALDALDDWVLTDPISDVVMRLTAIRRGDPRNALPPRPAAAMRILHTFALRRKIGDLLESTRHFEHLDAMAILAAAALKRPVEEAADLALGQWRREARHDARTQLTDGIVHDVASQRTAPEVSVFVKRIREEPGAELADQTLRIFAGSGSGRTNLDKAVLYIMLRDDGCRSEAAELLKLTLREVGARARSAATDGPDELHDLVGALHHLSPTQRILEDWILEAMRDPLDVDATIVLVANLLAGAPSGAESLASYVGDTWDHHDLVQVCGLLHERAAPAFTAVRDFLAARSDFRFLAEIIIGWHRSPTLTKSTKDLIAAIVARQAAATDTESEATGTRSQMDIDRIHANLKAYGAPADCLRMLRIAAAADIDGRSGEEIAELLHRVEGSRDRRLAARTIGERLAEKVLRNRTAIGRDQFIDYLKALRSDEDADSTYWALRELTDPSAEDQTLDGTAAMIGVLARRLYAERLGEAGFTLLERCLENEQWFTPRDVVEVVASLRDSRMPRESRLDLLSATVGRWAELRRRGQAVTELHERGFDDEAEAVIHALR